MKGERTGKTPGKASGCVSRLTNSNTVKEHCPPWDLSFPRTQRAGCQPHLTDNSWCPAPYPKLSVYTSCHCSGMWPSSQFRPPSPETTTTILSLQRIRSQNAQYPLSYTPVNNLEHTRGPLLGACGREFRSGQPDNQSTLTDPLYSAQDSVPSSLCEQIHNLFISVKKMQRTHLYILASEHAKMIKRQNKSFLKNKSKILRIFFDMKIFNILIC